MMRATFLVTALLALGAVAGCGGDDDKTSDDSKSTTPAATTSTSSPTSKAGEDYPAEVEQTFMRECKRTSGGKTAICQCAFDKIEATISYEEFKREDTAIAAGATPSRKFTDAIADCR